MAFRILSEKELAVLSERERQSYEAEYKEYSERRAFVERLEYLEGVRFPKVKPKKTPVKIIKCPEISVRPNEQFKAVQPEITKNTALFSRKGLNKPNIPEISKVSVSGVPVAAVPETEKAIEIPGYKAEPFTAFDFARVKRQNEAVLSGSAQTVPAEARLKALPDVNTAEVPGINGSIPEYSAALPESVIISGTSGLKPVMIPDAEVQLPAGNILPFADISVRELSVSDYKCTDMPEVKIAGVSVSDVKTDGQFRAEVPGAFIAKADVPKVSAGEQFRAEVPGAFIANADVPKVSAGEQFKAEVPGAFIAKADVPKVSAGEQFKAEVPGAFIAKADVPKVGAGEQFRAEVPGAFIAKADVPKVSAGEQFRAEVPGAFIAKADVPKVGAGEQFKAEVPGAFIAKVPQTDIQLPEKQPQKKLFRPVKPEVPDTDRSIKDHIPVSVTGVAVPVVGELPKLNGTSDIKLTQPFVAKPVQIDVRIDLPVQKSAEFKPFIAKAEIPDSSETIRTILGLLR